MNCISSIADLHDAVLMYSCMEALNASISVCRLTLMWQPIEAKVAVFAAMHTAIIIGTRFSTLVVLGRESDGLYLRTIRDPMIFFYARQAKQAGRQAQPDRVTKKLHDDDDDDESLKEETRINTMIHVRGNCSRFFHGANERRREKERGGMAARRPRIGKLRS